MINESTIRKMTRSITFVRGKELFENRQVEDFQMHTHTDEWGDEIREIEAWVCGSYQNEYEISLEVNETISEITSVYCECPAFETYDGICKHCVAVLLEYLKEREKALEEEGFNLEEFFKSQGIQKGMQNVKGRKTETSLQKILTRYSLREHAAYLPETKSGQVQITPLLHFSSGNLSVDFKIGITQMYVLKSIYQLITDIRNVENRSYGKKLSFLHCMDAFDEKSREIVHFLEHYADTHEMVFFQRYGSLYSGDERVLRLRDEDLDDFMALFLGQTIDVEYTVRNEKTTKCCTVLNQSPMQKITVKGCDDGIILHHSLARGIDGKYYTYYLSSPDKGKIYRVSRKDTEYNDEFLEYMVSTNGKDIFIGKEELPVFCKNILPILETNHKMNYENFSPQTYIPEELKLKIYLDAPQADMISCKASAVYGDKEFSLFEPYGKMTKMQLRDLRKEGMAKEVIAGYFHAYEERTQSMVLQGEEEIYDFLTEGIEKMRALGEVYLSETLKKFQIVSKPKVQVGVSFEGGLLQLSMNSTQFSGEQLAEILSRYEKKKKYYRLKDGEFIRMDEESMKALVDMKENLQLTDKQILEGQATVPRFRALYLDARLKGEGLSVKKSRDFKKMVRDMKTIEDNDFELPESLELILRSYQKTGFLWIKTLCCNGFGGILADDMGLGKTLQTIAFLLSEFQEAQGEERKALIVTPASLVYNWKNEFEQFAPEITVYPVVGNVKERAEMLSNGPSQVVYITSYQLLNRDEAFYKDIEFDYQVIDEAQFIKNQGNLTTRSVKAVNARFRMALTGTPVENRLSELWSIFDYVMPGFLYKYQQFRKEMETPIVKHQNPEILERLQKMIQPFVLRRTKKEVLKELPDKIERIMPAVMEGEQRELYDAHVQRLQMQLAKQSDEEFRTSKIEILAELTRLRQVCCDPSLLYADYRGQAAKMDLCMELVESAVQAGHKILLFSQFTSMLDHITGELTKREISWYLLTGHTAKKERVQMAEAFNQDDTSVFCISLKAGGTGLNLTGADIVIHFDPWWNAAAETQAEDRAHRIGQKEVVTVYKLIAKNSLEEKIVQLQTRKKELASQVLGGEGIQEASFSREELLELLENH